MGRTWRCLTWRRCGRRCQGSGSTPPAAAASTCRPAHPPQQRPGACRLWPRDRASRRSRKRRLLASFLRSRAARRSLWPPASRHVCQELPGRLAVGPPTSGLLRPPECTLRTSRILPNLCPLRTSACSDESIVVLMLVTLEGLGNGMTGHAGYIILQRILVDSALLGHDTTRTVYCIWMCT